MRNVLALATGLAMLAGVATAQNFATIALSTSDAAGPDGTNPEFAAPGDYTLYIWAELQAGALYNSVGLTAETTGALTAAGELYDPIFFGGALRRWTPSNPDGTGSDFTFDSDGDDALAFRVTEQGLGAFTDVPVDGWLLIGEVTLSGGPGELYLGYNEMARVGLSKGQEVIFYGFGDDGLQTLDENIGATTDVAEATVLPEPASLVLLALAGLAIRRR